MLLKNLRLFGFRMCGLEDAESKEDAEKIMLKQIKNLNKLEMEWGSSSRSGRDDIETCEEVLEGYEPHQNLQSLTIRGYQGVKVAKWMVKKSWPLHLQSLTLSHCKSIREISFLPPTLRELYVVHCDELKQLPPFGRTLKKLDLGDCPVSTLQSMPNNSTSLESLIVRGCPMLMTDEPLLVGDTAKCFSLVGSFITDKPLLVLVLVQQQAFSSVKFLLFEQEAKPFPRLLEDHFHEFSSLDILWLEGFKMLLSLPNLEKLYSLKELHIYDCHDVELLPNLPVYLKYIRISRSPKLQVKYKKDGSLHRTISHIPRVDIYLVLCQELTQANN